MEQIEIRPIVSSEWDAFKECISISFSKNPKQPTVPGFFRQLNYMPLIRPEFAWGVFFEGKPVAGFMMIPFEIMINETPLQVVGLTGVGTHPNYRHRGYASKIIQEAHKYLIQENFDGAILHSAADILYQKNGYEFAFLEWNGEIPWKSSLLYEKFPNYSPHSKKYVDFVLGMDLTDELISKLYNFRRNSNQFKNRPVRTARTLYYFGQKLREHIEGGKILSVLFDEKNEINAYLLVTTLNQDVEIIEQFSLENEAERNYLTLLDSLMDEFDHPYSKINIKFYFEDEIIKDLITKFGGTYSPNLITNNMAILFDPDKILQKMQPTFTIRYGNSLINDKLEFILQIDQDKYWIKAHPALVSIHAICNKERNISENKEINRKLDNLPHFSLTKREWIAITFGYMPIEDSEAFEDIQNNSLLQQGLKILFPKLEPVWDYFQKY